MCPPQSRIPRDPPAARSILDASAAVEVWHAGLAGGEADLVRLARCLDPDEECRAARFRDHRDRRRFQASRGLLRHILSTYVDTPPERLVLGYGARGKPFLAKHPEIQFNLSHTDDVLVVGVARNRRLGIDVERLIPERVMEEILETVASGPERTLLGALDRAERGERFMQLWTRKEAYIKADGRGMAIDLKGVDVLSEPGRVCLPDGHAAGWAPSLDWSVQDLHLGTGVAAAVVAEGSGWKTAHFAWPARGR